MSKKKSKNKEPNYFLWYILSVAMTLLFNYLFIANIKTHPTMQLFLSFLFFTFLLGGIMILVEKVKSKK